MVSIHTNLGENRVKDIEDIIERSGRIVSFNDIKQDIGNRYSPSYLKKITHTLIQKGWLIPLKKGLYYIADLTSRNFAGISPLVIASALNDNSYVSLESAFSFYGIFEQMTRATHSITTKRSKQYIFQDHVYRYSKIKQILFFGFRREPVEGRYVKIAELEKAILDYLYLKSDTYSMDLLMEKLRQAEEMIDVEKLFSYAEKFTETTKRKLGFIMDVLDVNTDALRKFVSINGYSKLTNKSNVFNSKWRIYYENRFIGQGAT